MPTDPSFWEVLLDDLTPGAKVLVLMLIVISILGGRALKILDGNLRETKDQAKLAADRSLPTSNGFARGVQEKLDVLVAGQAKTEKRLKKLETIAREQHPEAAADLDSVRSRRD